MSLPHQCPSHHSRLFRLFTLLCSLYLFSPQTLAQITAVNIDNDNKHFLSGHLEYYRTPSSQDIVDPRQFTYQAFHADSVPSDQSDYWFHAVIDNQGQPARRLILSLGDYLFDQVEFIYWKNGQPIRYLTGSRYPYDSRAIDFRHLIFPIDIEANQTLDIYFRVNNYYRNHFDPIITTEFGFTKVATVDTASAMLFVGILSGVLVYVLLIAFYTHEFEDTLVFGLYLLMGILTIL